MLALASLDLSRHQGRVSDRQNSPEMYLSVTAMCYLIVSGKFALKIVSEIEMEHLFKTIVE